MPTKYEDLFKHRAIIGTPEKYIAEIRALEAEGLENFICNFDFGGIPHAKVMRSMELFSREVMPHFAKGAFGNSYASRDRC